MALGFLAPALILMLLFKVWPIGSAIGASIATYDPAGNRVGYAGFDNLSFALGSSRFHQGLWLTAIAAIIKVPLQVFLGLAAAAAFLNQTSANKFARALIVSPLFLGLPVTALLFAYIFDGNIGLMNTVLLSFGMATVDWLNSPLPAQFVLIALSVWRDVGLTMLIFLAGLSAVPTTIILAAKLDGANSWRLFWTITWPLLRRSVQFAVVLATLASFQLVVPILILTNGGPLGATDLAAYQIYEQSFLIYDFGLAAAMSLILVLGLFLVIAAEIRWLEAKWRPL